MNSYTVILSLFITLSLLACSDSKISGNDDENYADNLVENGNFDNNRIYPWKFNSRELELTEEGRLIVSGTAIESHVYAYQNIECDPGKVYTVSCEVEKDPTATEVGVFAVYGQNGENENIKGVKIQTEGVQTIIFDYETFSDSTFNQTSFDIQLRAYKRSTSHFCQGFFDNVEVN